MSARRPPGDAGLTLVEALVSLFVFSIIATGCVAMLMQSVASEQRVRAAHAAIREVQIARMLLSGDLLQMAPRSVRDGGARTPVLLGDGAGARLAFVRASSEPDAAGGAFTSLSYVEYFVRDGALIRRARARLDAGAQNAGERVVFAQVEEARFSFFDGVQWRDAWLIGADGGGAPPRAVALSVRTPRFGVVRIASAVGLRS